MTGWTSRSRLRKSLVLVVLLALGLAFFRRVQVRARAVQPPTPSGASLESRGAPVVVAPARTGSMPEYVNALGTVTAFNTVTVRSRVDGQLLHVRFQEGQEVRRGEILAEIDPRPFEVQLAQAEGQLARDQAELQNAKVDLARYQTLVEEDSIPKQQLDTQVATVAQSEATLKVDEAAIDSARLQLSYCRIEAPIGGKVGLRLVDEGNIVHASDAQGLLVITQVEPIAVVFAIPEDRLPAVLTRLVGGDRMPVEAYDREGTTRIASGSLLAADNQIDPSTGTSRLKAVFSNRDGSLFPNQFVNVRLRLDVHEGAVIVPTAAIQRGPQGAYLYVVKTDDTVELREIVPGISEADDTAIETGLAAGERVVVEGADRLQAGSKVDAKRTASGDPAVSEREP